MGDPRDGRRDVLLCSAAWIVVISREQKESERFTPQPYLVPSLKTRPVKDVERKSSRNARVISAHLDEGVSRRVQQARVMLAYEQGTLEEGERSWKWCREGRQIYRELR